MKKAIALLLICLSFTVVGFGQKLNKKTSRQIVEKVWDCVKNSDTTGFRKMWLINSEQWPYHSKPFDVHDVKLNFLDFKSYFDTALVKKLKIDEVECDTIEHDDPHRPYAQYYIRAWFKYNNHLRRGFGLYMDYIDNKWLIRFSPDYSEDHPSGKK